MGPRAGLEECGKSRLHRDLFVFFCTLYFIRNWSFCLDCLAFCLLSFPATHNITIHAPGGIRTRNPRMRSAAVRRLRPLGHWYRRIRSPDPSARSESLYRLRNPSPLSTVTRINKRFLFNYISFMHGMHCFEANDL